MIFRMFFASILVVLVTSIEGLSQETVTTEQLKVKVLAYLNPRVPSRAQRARVDGYCDVSYTVGIDGKVIADSVRVINDVAVKRKSRKDKSHKNYFTKACMKAAQKIANVPPVLGDQPVQVSGNIQRYYFYYHMKNAVIK